MERREEVRMAFTVHYDGGAYHGWQVQRGQTTVQGELERVLTRLLDRPARILGSGRTDRGVHAIGQVAAVDVPARWSAGALVRAMNALLPQDIWVAHLAQVGGDFHPRYDALSRSYVYRVGTAPVAGSPFHVRWCWPVRRQLDLGLMRTGTAALLGEHSFRAFAKAGQEERGDRCMVTNAEWRDWSPLGLEFHTTANRFLHHMVRYLVGTIVEIGMGRRPVTDMERLLDGSTGLETSPPAPPQGLFLTRVTYPDDSYSPGPALAGGRGVLPLTTT